MGELSGEIVDRDVEAPIDPDILDEFGDELPLATCELTAKERGVDGNFFWWSWQAHHCLHAFDQGIVAERPTAADIVLSDHICNPYVVFLVNLDHEGFAEGKPGRCKTDTTESRRSNLLILVPRQILLLGLREVSAERDYEATSPQTNVVTDVRDGNVGQTLDVLKKVALHVLDDGGGLSRFTGLSFGFIAHNQLSWRLSNPEPS